jgi:hypothetical protein
MSDQTNSEGGRLCAAYGGCDQRASFLIIATRIGGEKVAGCFCQKHYDAMRDDLRGYTKKVRI